jgi:hypothetical protein
VNAATVAAAQRFTAAHPCPICGGHNQTPPGQGRRCYGFVSHDGRYAHCTREEYAGRLTFDAAGTYAHVLDGACRCGTTHGTPPYRQNGHAVSRCIRTTRYPARDAVTGEIVAIHVRRDFDDGSKRMCWDQPDGTSGLGGRSVAGFALDGIQTLTTTDCPVVVEGEKARAALTGLGIAAVGTVTGAKIIPCDDALQPLLALDFVPLWPDNDGDGESHMSRIAARLHAMGHGDIRRIAWPGAPAKGDAADLVDAGGTAETAEDVRRLVAAAEPWTASAEMDSDAFREEEPSETTFRFRTARELAAATSERPEWIAPPYVVSGGITELDGKAKAAGKTTWTLALCRSALDGLPFMGQPTVKTPVVYLTEQSPASFRESLRRAGLLERDDFHLLTWHETRGAEWPAIATAAVAKARTVEARLLVVDTLPQFAGMKGDTENDSGAALAAVEPLQAGAADGLAVLMLRHERKSGGDVGDSGRGSSAFAGAVDIVLSLRRAEGAARPTIRHLHALSRFDETPDLLVIELTPDGYGSLGTETAVAEVEARMRVLSAAPTNEADALKEAELLDAAEVRRTVGRDAISFHLAAGRVRRIGEGKRGDPFRYWRPLANDSDGTQGVASETNDDPQDGGEFDSDASSSFGKSETIVPEGSGIYVCIGCGWPRSRDVRPCPKCGATVGITR